MCQAYEITQRRIREVCAQMMRAMAPAVQRASRGRGQWLLLGVDILIDEQLRPTIVEANSNPELTMDSVRSALNRRLARGMFDLLVESHMKARPLFATGRANGGNCSLVSSIDFKPVARDSPAAQALLTTDVPGWSLLYSEAVHPPFSAAPTRAGSECYAYT